MRCEPATQDSGVCTNSIIPHDPPLTLIVVIPEISAAVRPLDFLSLLRVK